MKKKILILLLLLTSSFCIAQNWFPPTNGNVGIGTTDPTAKLDVNGAVKVKENLFITGASGGYTTGDNPILFFGVSNGFARINIPFGDKMILSSYHGYTFKTSYNGETPVTALTIGITGDVGIGVTNPDEKLTVKGKIHAQEIRIDMAEPIVPDYVFANDYKLRTLQEVEDYVKENRHLPEIPSAATIEKKGLMLAEMNMSLLKKIEELTLYAIEQKKELNNQKEEIIQLKKYNTELELIKERLLKLEDK